MLSSAFSRPWLLVRRGRRGEGREGPDLSAPAPWGMGGEPQVLWGCASESPPLGKVPEAAMRGWGPPGDVWGQGPRACGSARPSPTSGARAHRVGQQSRPQTAGPAPWASESTPHSSLPATLSPSGPNRKRVWTQRATCLGLWAFCAHLPCPSIACSRPSPDLKTILKAPQLNLLQILTPIPACGVFPNHNRAILCDTSGVSCSSTQL